MKISSVRTWFLWMMVRFFYTGREYIGLVVSLLWRRGTLPMDIVASNDPEIVVHRDWFGN